MNEHESIDERKWEMQGSAWSRGWTPSVGFTGPPIVGVIMLLSIAAVYAWGFYWIFAAPVAAIAFTVARKKRARHRREAWKRGERDTP